MDDNSPNFDIDDMISSYEEDRILGFNSHVADEDRPKSCRYAVNINEALKLCRSDYVTYLTDDNEYLPHRLQTMADYLDNNPDVGVVYGQQFCYYADDSGIPFVRSPIGPLRYAASLVDHDSVMHRRSIAEEVGFWETSPTFWGHADAVFWQKMNDAGYWFFPIDEILDKHCFHQDSAQSKMQRGVMPYEIG
jgi:spore maturation protein CgeD